MESYIIECSHKPGFVPFGWLIKKFQGLPFSHYALVFINHDGLMKTVDASGRTVHQESIVNFKEKYDIVRTYKIEDGQKSLREFKHWLYPFEGKKYGYKQVLGLFLMSLHIFKKNPFYNDKENIICNELILRYLRFHNLLPNIRFDDWDLVKTRKYLELHFKYEEGDALLTTRL